MPTGNGVCGVRRGDPDHTAYVVHRRPHDAIRAPSAEAGEATFGSLRGTAPVLDLTTARRGAHHRWRAGTEAGADAGDGAGVGSAGALGKAAG